MNQYLLSTYMVDGEVPDQPMTPEVMQSMMEGTLALEAEMEETGTFVFGGRLSGPDAATVVRKGETDAIMTDGPFAESKEHIAGFYIINAVDLDAALAWAARVSEMTGGPIEVYPFAATGRMRDQFPDMSND